jgi:hypothetical protein
MSWLATTDDWAEERPSAKDCGTTQAIKKKNKLNPAMYDLIRNLPSRKCAKAQHAGKEFFLIRHATVTRSPSNHSF